jgi:hypothetical protein
VLLELVSKGCWPLNSQLKNLRCSRSVSQERRDQNQKQNQNPKRPKNPGKQSQTQAGVGNENQKPSLQPVDGSLRLPEAEQTCYQHWLPHCCRGRHHSQPPRAHSLRSGCSHPPWGGGADAQKKLRDLIGR